MICKPTYMPPLPATHPEPGAGISVQAPGSVLLSHDPLRILPSALFKIFNLFIIVFGCTESLFPHVGFL